MCILVLTDPAIAALHAALGSGLIGHFASNRWQLATLARHDPTHQGSLRGQYAQGILFRLAWIFDTLPTQQT